MLIRRFWKSHTVYNIDDEIPTTNPTNMNTNFIIGFGILILIFYSSITVRIRINSVYQPTLNEYEQLYTKYSSTLQYPCTLLSVPYSSIIYIKPYYHQVCSSDLIEDNAWLLYFRGFSGSFHTSDFRLRGLKTFTILQALCEKSNETIKNELAVFNNLQFINARVPTNNTFHIQTLTLIQQFQQQVLDKDKILASFLDLFELVRISIQLNQFIVGHTSNAKLLKLSISNNYFYRFVANKNWNNNCSCGTSVSCSRSEGFYCRITSCFATLAEPNQTIPGLIMTCLLVDSLLTSSLECFYNKSCIDMLIEWRSFESSDAKIDTRLVNIKRLDPTINSRFSPNTKLANIVSQ
ncbi:unnamed protein product [Rotaria sp. Silwood2]|nr:unnamed protein product [Rotaria sp. Silwood2]